MRHRRRRRCPVQPTLDDGSDNHDNADTRVIDDVTANHYHHHDAPKHDDDAATNHYHDPSTHHDDAAANNDDYDSAADHDNDDQAFRDPHRHDRGIRHEPGDACDQGWRHGEVDECREHGPRHHLRGGPRSRRRLGVAHIRAGRVVVEDLRYTRHL